MLFDLVTIPDQISKLPFSRRDAYGKGLEANNRNLYCNLSYYKVVTLAECQPD